MKLSALTLTFALTAAAFGQDLTRVSPPQTRMVIIKGGTVHTVANGTIENGAVIFAEGKLTSVYTAKEAEDFLASARFAAPGPEIIDATGKHIYPGLIAPQSAIGITDIAALRQPRDADETGDFTPEVVPAHAVNPDSWFLPVARAGGVFAAGLFPQGGTVPGQVSVIRMHGWTNDDLTVAGSAGIVLAWPNVRSDTTPADRGSGEGRQDTPAPRDEARPLDRIAELLDKARSYDAERTAYADRSIDLRWEAMRPLFANPEDRVNGARVFVLASDVDQITSAVAFLAERKLRTVIVGGRDALLAAELLKKHDVPVIIDNVNRMPRRSDSPYDEAFRLPKALKDAGIRFCIASGEEPANERNLPHYAGTAAAYGLDQTDAVKAITQWPAEILGVGDQLGTLQTGRPATLMIADGNILEVTTRVERGWIDGRALDLSTKQTELLKKYEEKYKQNGMLKDK
ncbi:MAG: amidohydrolase family protein [Tepidisphaera sp.]